ncbi:MAG: NAD(+) diphosphatase [Calditrichaceae bacterium]
MKKNSFSTDFIDRASAERINTNWVETQLKNSTTKIIPVCQTRVFCKEDAYQQPVLLSLKDFDKYVDQPEAFIFLGLVNNQAYFAKEINSAESAEKLSKIYNGRFFDFRQAVPLLSYEEYTLQALARFMIIWHSRNTYCGKCGQKTELLEGGNVRICSNEACKENFYPSMDPAVIVLVTSGDNCLLGRQSPWPKNMYSTIAGFVEPGENLEDAVYREVDEETGIRVESIQYYSSQPWLFPSSLMLGFYAKAINTNIDNTINELDDFRWFTRKEI